MDTIMAEFEVRFNGIPFTVGGVETREQAQRRLEGAIQERPDMLSNQAQKIGFDFDQQTQRGRPRGGFDRFMIGAGHELKGTLDFIEEIVLESQDDFSGLERLDQRRADDAEAFERLDRDEEQAFFEFDATDFGQATAGGLQLLVGAGVAGKLIAPALRLGARGIAALRFLSPLKWGKAATEAAMKRMASNGLDAQRIAAALQTKKGADVVKAATKLKKPSPKAAEAIADKIDDAAQAAFRPGANVRVREAQVRAQQALRGQGGTPASVSAESQAAQQATAQRVSQTVASNRAAAVDRGRRIQAGQSQAVNSSRLANRERIRQELRDIIRDINTR